jgi:hypothetical protein
LKVSTRHEFDEASTPRHTTLALKVGSGTGHQRGTIHWHVAAQNEVRYTSRDDEREDMLWVEVRRPDGTYWRYADARSLEDLPPAGKTAAIVRIMDCVDCHNRATHIYEDPEDAVDRRIAAGWLDRRIPFLKREALAALTGSYTEDSGALAGIRNDVYGTYRREFPAQTLGLQDALDTVVTELQAAYERNIHPQMNVGWNSYADHRGHRDGGGCFRCHNRDMVDADGKPIPYNCTLCHSILSYDSVEHFRFLQPVDEKSRDRRMHAYLQAEFLERERPRGVSFKRPQEDGPQRTSALEPERLAAAR